MNCLTCLRYDFEYEDDDEQETGDVDVENKYYNAKQMKADNPEEAITEFLGLPAREEEKGDWAITSQLLTRKFTDYRRGFKGLKQAIKLEFKLGQYDKACSILSFHSPVIITDDILGCGALPRATDICQICCYEELFGKVNQ